MHSISKKKLIASFQKNYAQQTSTKSLLLIGGKGQLGAEIEKTFSSSNWNVNIMDVDEVCRYVKDDLMIDKDLLNKDFGGSKFDAVINVAGGWAGGNIANDNILQTLKAMFDANVFTSFFAGHMASKYLKEGGLLVLTGAQVAEEGTSSMVSYGATKAATHQLTLSLSDSHSMPKNAIVTAICPLTLDTQANRNAMPKADKSSWTPLVDVSFILFSWAAHNGDLPKTGSLVKFEKSLKKWSYLKE
jgi:dihydropteridine reductase